VANTSFQGYYFTASQETSQLDLAKRAGEVLESHGLIKSAEPKQIPVDVVKAMWLGGDWPYLGLYTFACNTRAKADRAKKYLGYQPSSPSVLDCMEDDLLACRRV
jgi:hypothetical protein